MNLLTVFGRALMALISRKPLLLNYLRRNDPFCQRAGGIDSFHVVIIAP
jgi:hypothetical protein